MNRIFETCQAATDLTMSHRYHGDKPGESVGTVARLPGAQQGRAGRGSYPAAPRVAQRARAARRERSRGRGGRRRERTETIISSVTAMPGRTVKV